jgi:hypothetical protein
MNINKIQITIFSNKINNLTIKMVILKIKSQGTEKAIKW